MREKIGDKISKKKKPDKFAKKEINHFSYWIDEENGKYESKHCKKESTRNTGREKISNKTENKRRYFHR